MAEDLQPTLAEQKLIDAAAKGEISNYQVGDEQADDPANGAEWGEDRTLRAEILYDLCVGARPEWKVHAKGVQVVGARITGSLDFQGAEIKAPLLLAFCRFDQPLILHDARTRTLSLQGSYCQGISADRMVVNGSVFLNDGFTAAGEVRLFGAEIRGDLSCRAGKFENPGGDALSADRMFVNGNVFLCEYFTAEGEVRLPDAKIGGVLDCSAGKFTNPDGRALTADRFVVRGDVFLWRGFSAEGEVRLPGADIGGDLLCQEGEFKNPGGDALNARNMKVTGTLFLGPKMSLPIGGLNLAHAEVGPLVDDVNSWPQPGELILDGFIYDAITGDSPTTAEERLRWLRLQPASRFWPQPYEQLIRVLRRMRHGRDALEVAIAKQDALRKSGELGWWNSIWRLYLGVTISYGYKPWKALVYMAIFLVLGTGFFYGAGFRGLMIPTRVHTTDIAPYLNCEKAYPCFNPVIYSLDAFIPIIDFHQQTYWMPDASKPGGWLYRAYHWLHIVMGWLVSPVALVGLTGIIKKD